VTLVVERQHSTYVVTFEGEHVRMVFDHLRNGTSALTAEVDILTSLPGYGPLIRDGQLNLLSEQTQGQWARKCALRCPEVTDWEGFIMEACRAVRKLLREGEPSVALRDIPRPAAGSWLIRGLTLARLPTLVFGDGSAGKSLLTLAIAETLQTSRRELLGLDPPAERVNVLWLDWEYDGWEHAQRSRAMLGLGTESDIRYRRMSGPLADQVDAIEKEVDRHTIGHIVVDSAAYACGGKPEDSEQTNRLFDALRRLDRGSTIIAHETKEAGRFGSHDKPFGSAYWYNGARVIWFVQKQQDTQDEQESVVRFHVGLFNKKTNQGRLWKPMGFAVEIKNDDIGDMLSCRFEREDVRDIEELRANTPLREQIKYCISRGGRPLNVAEIAKELDAKDNSILKTVQRMVKNRELVVVDVRGTVAFYGLAVNRVDLGDIDF